MCKHTNRLTDKTNNGNNLVSDMFCVMTVCIQEEKRSQNNCFKSSKITFIEIFCVHAKENHYKIEQNPIAMTVI